MPAALLASDVPAFDSGRGRRAHTRRILAGAAIVALAAANGGIVVWLWLHGGGVSGIHGTADLLTSLGRITGLLGAYLALIQVLLLARLPVLERLVGFDRLTAWHRINGKVCIGGLVAHTVLITLGYEMTDGVSLGSEISSLFRDYPGIVTATIGTGLLVLVVLTSLVIVRKRLPYELWYAIHLTVYAGIALAWSHQIPTGNELTADHAAADYWTGLYIAALALLVVFRVMSPAIRAARHRLRVASVTVESPTVVSLEITGRRLDRLGVSAGQFFIWRFLTLQRWWQPHPFSLSAAPDGDRLRITVKHAGDFTRRMASIPVGTRVLAEGPFGLFGETVRRRDRVALIAGGIGITPVRALLETMARHVVVVWRVLSEDDLVLRDELDDLARTRNARVLYVVGDHAAPGGDRLLSEEHLHELVPDLAERDVYVCGPPGMVKVLEARVRRAGVPRKQIHIERFAL